MTIHLTSLPGSTIISSLLVDELVFIFITSNNRTIHHITAELLAHVRQETKKLFKLPVAGDLPSSIALFGLIDRSIG